jgi:hypothetical protein
MVLHYAIFFFFWHIQLAMLVATKEKHTTPWHITPMATPKLIQFYSKDLSTPGFHQAHAEG